MSQLTGGFFVFTSVVRYVFCVLMCCCNTQPTTTTSFFLLLFSMGEELKLHVAIDGRILLFSSVVRINEYRLHRHPSLSHFIKTQFTQCHMPAVTLVLCIKSYFAKRPATIAGK